MRFVKSFLFPMTAVACVVAAIAAGAVWASGSGHSAALGPTAVSCSSAPLPRANQEVNTILDKEHGLLTYSFYDSARGEDTSATIDYKAAPCLSVSRFKGLIDHVVATDAQAQAQTCVSIREQVAANVSTVEGKHFNLDAAKRYISEWC
jgi:hypothetical protein